MYFRTFHPNYLFLSFFLLKKRKNALQNAEIYVFLQVKS